MKQQGLTIIELLIAMVIALLLMVGVIQVMLSTKNTIRTNDDLARIQENGRFSFDILISDISMAGFRRNGNSLAFFLTSACAPFDPCTNNGAANASDRIAVQYDPDNDVDCIDTPVGAMDVIVNVYHITTTNGISSLNCRGWNETTNSWIAASQILIDGIDNMQALYGVKVDTSVTQYVSADRVTDWSQVQAVRIGLLVSNGYLEGKSMEKTRQYVLLDSPVLSFNDMHLRRVYNTTIILNNAFNSG